MPSTKTPKDPFLMLQILSEPGSSVRRKPDTTGISSFLYGDTAKRPNRPPVSRKTRFGSARTVQNPTPLGTILIFDETVKEHIVPNSLQTEFSVAVPSMMLAR